jgi:hypothetical protein
MGKIEIMICDDPCDGYTKNPCRSTCIYTGSEVKKGGTCVFARPKNLQKEDSRLAELVRLYKLTQAS